MGQIGSILSASGNLGIMYAQRLLVGVKPDTFARLARPGGQVIQSNHPAFIFGHLALYPSKIMQLLKVDAGQTTCPDPYPALFEGGSKCKDDADANIYPAMQELTERFFAAYGAGVNAVALADDAALTAQNPIEGRMRELFPTIGAAICFYLGGHVQNHLGQMSAWRRAIGLGEA